MEQDILTQGGIYLAKLNPAKGAEIGKVRPVIILNSQAILDALPPVIFICPLSSQSHPALNSLHINLLPRDQLKVTSYALVEHCRSITTERIHFPRIAQLTLNEIKTIIRKLQLLVRI